MAKRLVFGTLYGQGISGFTASVNAMTGKRYTQDEVARDFMGPLFAPYPKVKTWMDRVADEHKEGNKVSYTPLGRRRLNVPDVPAALNTPIQAGATDVMKAIAVAVYRTKEPSWELVGIVHDEILMEVPQEAAEEARHSIHKIMVEVGERVVNYKTPDTHKVPVDAETHVCDSWAEKD